MKRTKATGIAVALLLLTGSVTRAQEPALATNLKDVVGIWRTVVSPAPREHFLQFKEDGTYRIAHAPEELELLRVPGHVGEFWFEGTQLFIKRTENDVPGNAVCIGLTGIYEVELLANGNLRFVEVEDECDGQTRNHFRAEEYEAAR